MKDKIKLSNNESSDNAETRSDVSRRDFLATSTGAIAAASVLAAGATLVSSEARAAGAPHRADSEEFSQHEKAVMAVYEDYISAFLANDIDGINAVCKFPIAHTGDGKTQHLDAWPVSPAKFKAEKNWHTTIDIEVQLWGVNETKGHVIARGTRVREDMSVIEKYTAVYMIGKFPEGWRIFAVSDIDVPV
jgi:hypothetical protein